MIMQLVYFSFMLGMFSTYAADDQLLRITMDESPAGYMQRLRADEAGVIDEIPGTFIFERDALISHVKTFMREYGLASYFDYFEALASTKKLREKIEPRYVEIPPITALIKKTKEEQQLVMDRLVGRLYNVDYPINRLLISSLCSLDVDVNKDYKHFRCNTLLHICLYKDDLPLVQKLLRRGANPNIGFPSLACCKSVQAAQWCLQYGAHFSEQHNKNDVILHLLCNPGTEASPDVLRLFLSYAPLDASNEFGKRWFGVLRKRALHVTLDKLLERIDLIDILLKAGCHYDEEQIQKLIGDIKQGYIYPPDDASEEEKYQQPALQAMAKSKIETLVAQDRKRRKNLVLSLQMRALTGKQLDKSCTNLSEPYKRAIGKSSPSE